MVKCSVGVNYCTSEIISCIYKQKIMDDGKESGEDTKHNIVWKRSEDEDNQSDVWDDSALIEAYDKAVSHVKEQIARRNKVGSESDGKSSRNSSHKGKKRGRSKLKRTWKVGDYCQAAYSEDGRYYEAVITHIKDGMCIVKFVGYENEENIHLNDIQHSRGKQARIQQSLAAQAYRNNVEQLETEETHWNHYADDTSSSTGIDPKQRLFSAHHDSGKKHVPPHASWYGVGRPPPPHLFPGQQHHTHIPSCLPPASTLPCHHRTSTSPRLPPIPPPPFPIEDGLVDDDEALASMLMSWYMSGYHTGYYQGLRQVQTHHCNTSKLNKSCSCPH